MSYIGGGSGAGSDFTGTPVTSTGSTTGRLIPARFADVITVKDYGAVGDGVHDDTSAIQLAVNSIYTQYSSNDNGTGVVFFPPCSHYYLVTGPIFFDPMGVAVGGKQLNSYIVRGSGDASKIIGGFNEFIFTDRVYKAGGAIGSQTITGTHKSGATCTFTGSITAAGVMTLTTALTDTLQLGDIITWSGVPTTVFVESLLSGSLGANGSTYQCYTWTAQQGCKSYHDLSLSNSGTYGGGIRMSSAVAGVISNCVIAANYGIILTANSHRADNTTSWSVAVSGCKVTPAQSYANLAATTGIPASTGIFLTETSTATDCDVTGGFDIAFGANGHACSIIGGRSEENTIGIQLGTLMDGIKYSLTGFRISAMTLEANFIGINIAGAGAGTIDGLSIIGGPDYGYNPPYYGVVASTTFTRSPGGGTFVGTIAIDGTLNVTSGTPPLVGDTLTWGAGPPTVAPAYVLAISGNSGNLSGYSMYHIRMNGDSTSQTTISGVTIGGGASVAGLSVNAPGVTSASGLHNTIQGCLVGNTSSLGVAWQMPTSAGDAVFINCNNPDATYLLANLPSGAGNVTVGAEYMISNSLNATSAANYWTIAASGGSNVAKVRWDNTNWRLV